MAFPTINNFYEPVLTLTAAGTGTYTSEQKINPNCRGLTLVINATAVSGTGPTLTVTVQGVDPISGTTFPLLASAAISATGQTVLRIFPGATVTANASANDQLPYKWQVSAVVAGTTPSFTATIAASVIR